MLFSAIAATCDRALVATVAALLWSFDFAKYHAQRPMRQTRATPAQSIAFVGRVLFVRIGADKSCRRLATSNADWGRLAGSFCKQAATTSSQIAGTDVG